MALLALVLVMWFAPKIATMIDVLTRPELRHAFGGGLRFVASVVTETIFFLLLSPIMWFAPHAVPRAAAVRPHRRLGRAGARRSRGAVVAGVAAVLAADAARAGAVAAARRHRPSAIPYALFIAGGPLLSIPLAVVTASPALGPRADRARPRPLAGRNAAAARIARARRLPAIELSQRARRHARDRYATNRWRTSRGVVRSLRHLLRRSQRAAPPWTASTRQFVRPGDLVFDIGAHVGDRVAAFRRLGARVVAVEPQPALVRDVAAPLSAAIAHVTIEPVAVGARAGTLDARAQPRQSDRIDRLGGVHPGGRRRAGLGGPAWTRTLRVPVTTLDALIAGTACRPSSRSTWRASRPRRWPG